MASIIKRGKTYSIVYYEGEGNDRHQVWESGLSYTAAKARKAKLELDMAENTHIDQNNITVGQFLNEFVEKYGTKKWMASTYEGNVGLLRNYVYPYWEDKTLRSIRTKTVDDFYHFLQHEAEPAANMGKPRREHINPSTIHDVHKVLRCAFNQALRWEYIAQNPFLKATLPEYSEKKRQALTPDQILRVLDFSDRPEYYDYYVLHCAIHLAFACCMRGGEVGGAQWGRLNMQGQVMYIDRVVDRVEKDLIRKLPKMEILFQFPNLFPATKSVVVLKQPKTEGSIRNVYIPDTVIRKLTVLKDMQETMRAEYGDDVYTDYDLIISQANGRPLLPEHINKRFKCMLADMGAKDISLDDIVFHSIRHTSAGMKLKLSHGDLKTVQAEGGWNTPDMVTKRYAHIIDEDRRELAEAMERNIYGNARVAPSEDLSQEMQALVELARSNPNLLIEVVRSVQSANT